MQKSKIKSTVVRNSLGTESMTEVGFFQHSGVLKKKQLKKELILKLGDQTQTRETTTREITGAYT